MNRQSVRLGQWGVPDSASIPFLHRCTFGVRAGLDALGCDLTRAQGIDGGGLGAVGELLVRATLYASLPQAIALLVGSYAAGRLNDEVLDVRGAA